MEKPVVIKRKRLPTVLPVQLSAITYLMLKQLNASGVAWGVALTLLAIIWIAMLVRLSLENEFDLKELELRQKISDASDKMSEK